MIPCISLSTVELMNRVASHNHHFPPWPETIVSAVVIEYSFIFDTFVSLIIDETIEIIPAKGELAAC